MTDPKPSTSRGHHPVLARTIRLLQKRAKRKNHEQSSSIENSLEMGHVSKTSFASSHNKVFGRHKELQQLLAIYEQISNGSTTNTCQLALVYGKSGVGKSAVVRAFVKRLPKQAIFVNGKFDQLKTHTPYAALIKAADDLSRKVLKQRDSKHILNRVQRELGPDLDLLGSILGALSSLAKNKKSTTIATSAQAFTRFKLLMRGFFRSIATPETPVVLFFDDLQWADMATIEVLQSLLTDKQSSCVFFIFSYRQDEMNQQQLLDEYLLAKKEDDSSGRGIPHRFRVEITNICVNNLDLTSLNKMVAAVLQSSVDVTLALSEMILRKTEGNPFYALNFMDKLYADGMLKKTDNVWTWNATTILQQTDVSDNLADILEAKILRLPERVRSILQLASFIGHDFSVNILLTIVHEEQDMIESEYSFDLFDKTVIQQWIVEALDLALKEGLLEESAGEKVFKFSHDKIQHCLYKDLMPDDVERRLLHQRIGKLIWNTIRLQEASTVEDWVLFLAADNLNRGPKFVDDGGDRVEMIELNARAGKLAASKAAFLVGVEYLRCGEKLITDDLFVENNYDLCLDLWRVAADMERTVGEFKRSDDLAKKIHKYARETEDEFPAYLTEIRSLAIQSKLTEAMELSFQVLKQMGVKFPKKITKLTVIQEFIRTKFMIGKRTPEELMNLPLLTDKKKLFALELLSSISTFAFIDGESSKFTFVSVILRMATLTIQYGLSDLYAPQAFVGYGTVSCFLGKINVGLSFGDAAQKLLNRFDAQSIEPRTQTQYLGCILPWKDGINEALGDSFLQVYHKGMQVGDVDYAFNASNSWLHCGFYGGVLLDELVTKGTRFRLEMDEYGQKTMLLFLIPSLQKARLLLGDKSNQDPSVLNGNDIVDLEEFTASVKETKSKAVLCSFLLCEVIVALHFGNWECVRDKVPILERVISAAEGYFTYPANLIHIVWSFYRLHDMTGKKRYRQIGRRHHQTLKRYAKLKNPIAITCCKVLTAAKAAFVDKKPVEECEELFVSALQDLEDSRSYSIYSFVVDGLAELFLKEDIDKGMKYLNKSLECNTRWGAKEKVKYLERQVSMLKDLHPVTRSMTTTL